MIIGEKIIEVAIKAIAKKFKLTKILEYVEKPNVLDESVERLFKINQGLAQRIGDLEKYYHNHPQSKRNFVVCDECKCKIEEK